MRELPPLPEPLSNRPFSITEAHRFGLDAERLRKRDLAAPFRGIRVPVSDAAAASLERPNDRSAHHPAAAQGPWANQRRQAIDRAFAYHAGISEHLVFSHVSAAQLHGLHLPQRLADDRTVHVATTVPSRRPKSRGVTAHLMRNRRPDVVIVHGMRVIEPVETWCQLAAVLGLDELITIGDQLVQRQHPFASMEQLRLAVHRSGGRHGIRRLRAALEWIRPRTDSPRETELRLLLTRNGLPEPEVNVPVLNRFGARVRLGDMVYPRRKVLVEYDGDQHRTDPMQYERDIRHLEELAHDGWRVIRVTNTQLRTSPSSVVARVRTALDAGSPQ